MDFSPSVIRPPVREVVRQAVRNPLILAASGGPSLTAQAQAAFAGRVGGMWDLGDTSTLYQQHIYGGTAFDAVAAPGQQIGLLIDKSKKSTWTDNTGSTWTKVNGDGVVTVVGNVITITGATTTTRVDRVGGTIPLVPGVAVFDVTAAWSTATGPTVWCRGAPQPPPNGSAQKVISGLGGSTLERVQIDTGTATFTINSLRYWEGNHATQSTAINRPLYQVDGSYGCARFDGVNDLLSTAAINLSASTMALVSIAFAPKDWAVGVVAEFGTGIENGTFSVIKGSPGSGNYVINARSTLTDQARNTAAISLVPVCVTAYIDLSKAATLSKIEATLNGVAGTHTSTADAADSSVNLANLALNLGARAGVSFPANMDLFAVVVRGGSATAGEFALFDQWTRSRVGL